MIFNMSAKIKLSLSYAEEKFSYAKLSIRPKSTIKHTKNLACIGSSLCKKGCWMEAQAAFLPF